jgi:predicted O-methyltransferase YrrM
MDTKVDNYLPVLRGMLNEYRNGRNVYEGYQRGWGLEFGSLRSNVQSDELYKEAIALTKKRTVILEERAMNIFLIMRFYMDKISSGDIIEFGSYKGGSAIFMAFLASKLFPDTRVWALDSFEGMPVTDKTVDAHNKNDFMDVDLDELNSYKKSLGLNNLEFCKGYFEDTAEKVLAKAKKITLAHIDCDIYSSVAYSYDIIKDHMVKGGYIIFDDATVSSCLGATEAVESLVVRRDGLNSEQVYPHFVFRAK